MVTVAFTWIKNVGYVLISIYQPCITTWIATWKNMELPALREILALWTQMSVFWVPQNSAECIFYLCCAPRHGTKEGSRRLLICLQAKRKISSTFTYKKFIHWEKKIILQTFIEMPLSKALKSQLLMFSCQEVWTLTVPAGYECVLVWSRVANKTCSSAHGKLALEVPKKKKCQQSCQHVNYSSFKHHFRLFLLSTDK